MGIIATNPYESQSQGMWAYQAFQDSLDRGVGDGGRQNYLV